ncbi:MAG: hypothetical protein WBD31_27190 [Rubripirellula sp.]
MNALRITICLFAFSVVSATGCSRHVAVNDPEAMAVIDQMARAYASCQTYRDTGTVTTIYLSSDGDETERKQFSTALSRPDQFRFEYSEPDVAQSRYIVWRNGDEVRTWWDLNQEDEQETSLGMAIAGATGVSSGSAHTVPALLMPVEIGGRLLTDLEAATLGKRTSLDGNTCILIHALYAGEPIEIWIDEQSHLVRRIHSTSGHGDFTTTETTVYDPVANEPLEPRLLEYNSPGPINGQ